MLKREVGRYVLSGFHFQIVVSKVQAVVWAILTAPNEKCRFNGKKLDDLTTLYTRTLNFKDSLSDGEVFEQWRYIMDEVIPAIRNVSGTQSVKINSGGGALWADITLHWEMLSPKRRSRRSRAWSEPGSLSAKE